MLIGKTPVTAILIGFQPIQSWTPRELQTSYFSPPGEMRGGGLGGIFGGITWLSGVTDGGEGGWERIICYKQSRKGVL